MLGYVQGYFCAHFKHVIVIISAIPQIDCYILCPTSSYEAVPKRTSLYLNRVTKENCTSKLNTTTDKIKSDAHTHSASASRYDIEQEDNSDYVKLYTDIIFKVMGYPVIRCFKLQPCITLFPTYKASSMSLRIIISLTAVSEEINKGLNLSHHQRLTFTANVHEDIMSALRLV